MSVESLRARMVDEGWTRERSLVVVLLLAAAPLLLPTFQVYLLTEFLIVALFAIAFNLLYGYTGLLSFGHAMFYAGAGYALVNFMGEYADAFGAFGGTEPLVTYLAGTAVGVAFVVAIALPVGFLSVRLEEIYFALISLSFSMAFYAAALQDVGGYTRGSDGISVLLTSVEVGGESVSLLGGRPPFYLLTLAIVGVSVYALWRIVNSPFGLVCQAMRESPDRARALGVDVQFHQWVAFVVSAVFTGIAGALIAPLYGVVSPDLAHWTTSAIPVIAAVIGGARYFLGPAVGAFIFLYLRWAISQYPALEAHWELVFGVVLMAVLLYFREGVAGGLDLARRRLLGRENGGETA